jgi:hypothetical protein
LARKSKLRERVGKKLVKKFGSPADENALHKRAEQSSIGLAIKNRMLPILDHMLSTKVIGDKLSRDLSKEDSFVNSILTRSQSVNLLDALGKDRLEAESVLLEARDKLTTSIKKKLEATKSMESRYNLYLGSRYVLTI